MTCLQDFPEGLPRREALHSKVQVFFRSRVAAAHRWDIALLRMIVSNVVRWHPHENAHSVYCWHVARNNAHCHCLHASPYFLHLNVYQASFRDRATLFASFNTLLSVGENDIAQDALDMLRFVLSIGEANELAVYFSMYVCPLFLISDVEFSSANWTIGLSTCSNIALPVRICTTPLYPCVQFPCPIFRIFRIFWSEKTSAPSSLFPLCCSKPKNSTRIQRYVFSVMPKAESRSN